MKLLKKYNYWFKAGILLLALAISSLIVDFTPSETTKKQSAHSGQIQSIDTVNPYNPKDAGQQNNEKETLQTNSVKTESNAAQKQKEDNAEKHEDNPEKQEDNPDKVENTLPKPSKQEKASYDKTPTDTSPKAEQPSTGQETEKLLCNLSVRCDAILDNIEKLKDEKRKLIPPDGLIFSNKKAEFFENETAFNVLLRELKQNGISFEFEHTPLYDSIYIEGINGIYEFDAGELSGWLYRVNGEFLNYSISKYTLKPDDTIEILYTCNLGTDIGAPIR